MEISLLVIIYYLSDYYVIHSCSEDIYFVSSFFLFSCSERFVKSPSTGGSLVLTSLLISSIERMIDSKNENRKSSRDP